MKYVLLRRKQKEKIREIARKHYMAESDPEVAKKKATEEIQVSGIIATILIGLAIRLAIELIIWWIKNNVMAPSIIYQDNEPQ